MPDQRLRVETRELNWAPGHGFASEGGGVGRGLSPAFLGPLCRAGACGGR